jgi:hypothetical protein
LRARPRVLNIHQRLRDAVTLRVGGASIVLLRLRELHLRRIERQRR